MAAVAYAAAIYLALFLSAWGFGLLDRDSLADLPGTLIVSLNDAEEATGAVPIGRETLPERPPETPPAPPAPAASKPAPTPTPKPAAAATAPKPAPVKPAATAKPAAAAATGPAATAPAATAPSATAAAPTPAVPEAAAPAVASQALTAAAAPSAAPAASAEPEPFVEGPPAPPVSKTYGSPTVASAGSPGLEAGSGSVTFRGTEKGNSLETAFGASSGTIGRSLYYFIYSYMPLPAIVSGVVYEAIPDQETGAPAEYRKKTFTQFYYHQGENWRLKAPVPIELRPALWFMLEDAGYDLAQADYKEGLASKSVTIEFAVGPYRGPDRPATLVDFGLVSSSGSAEIDEAVLYGFRQANFFNTNPFAVSGRFTYRFGK